MGPAQFQDVNQDQVQEEMVYQEDIIRVSNDIKLLENANDTLKKANEMISSNIPEVKYIKFN